jgi:outer membrane protein
MDKALDSAERAQLRWPAFSILLPREKTTMRRLLIGFFLPAVLLATGARAQAGVKIGYVDVQRAVQEVEEGKAARARLKTELDSRRAELDKKRQDLEKMKTDYDKQAPVLSDDAKRKKQEELQRAFTDAQQTAGLMQEELSGKEQEAMGSISKRMIQIVSEVSEREGFSYVLDKAVLLYAPAASDLTNEVVRRYNDKFGAGKAPAAKAPAGKAAPKPAAQAPAVKK